MVRKPLVMSRRSRTPWLWALALCFVAALAGCDAGTSRFDPDIDGTSGGGTGGGGASPTTPPEPTAVAARGMWVWNSNDVLASNANQSALVTAAAQAQVTDLYFFVEATQYASEAAALRTFIAQATNANVRVWALDGARTYFDDATGPTQLYEGISNLVAFNQQAAANERFYGFQADDEPQDQGDYTSFHDGIADADLSTVSGSGVWQDTQAQDREMLMRDWLTIHITVQNTLHAAGLRFGAAMPDWLSDYEGAPVNVDFPSATSPRQGVMQSMMNIVDEYVVMSYNTNPNAAAGLTDVPSQYASGFPAERQPWVFGAVETTPGEGSGVSYADTPGKDSRSVVLTDINDISTQLRNNTAFHGMVIEQYSAWDALPK